MMPRHVFVTGGTGYIGLALLDALVTRGHKVRALVRPASAPLLPPGVGPVFGNALDAESYADEVPPADTFVQLVGTPHPGPGQVAEFARVDLPSGLAAVNASVEANVRHLVYVSVAHPAPVMHAYIAARTAVEARIGEACATSWLAATILRPWYVLGPGHRWPYLLTPLYALGRALPPTREGALRLGLVTRTQMVAALVEAVENPPDSSFSEPRVWEVPRIARAHTAMEGVR
ncbi:MAG TPA: NAD(P)H-binding protein [Gemmatimonadaceae bacterium]|nr:NAD(P)H-binding protein [Gemmatimonadaceae bacterium]